MGKRKFLLSVFRLLDLLIIAACTLTAWALASSVDPLDLHALLSTPMLVSEVLLLSLLVWGWYLICNGCGLYDSKRLATLNHEAVDLVKATLLVTGVTVPAIALVYEPPISLLLWFIVVLQTFLISLLLTSRLLLRWLLACVRRYGRNLNHVLIVGTNPRAMLLERLLDARPDLGCHVIGFVDDQWYPGEPAQSHRPIVAPMASLGSYIREHVVDEVVLCVPIKSFYEEASRILDLCSEQGITVRVFSDPFRSFADLSAWEDQQVLAAVTQEKQPGAGLVKRTVDIAVSGSLLVLCSPLLALVALLITVTSPGGAIFAQERVGLNKRRFRLYKFRTMIDNAENLMADLNHLNETEGPTFKMVHDPRVTPIGRLLRRYSIDELPQLVNVLLGDMSLVGPRPLPVRDYEGFNVDRHRRRLSVKPGITCLWQVQGRNSIPFDKWMELDLEYIERWSLWLDTKILIKTIPAVIRATGAS